MRLYTQPHRFYCGIDLHTRTMFLLMLDRDQTPFANARLAQQNCRSVYLNGIGVRRHGCSATNRLAGPRREGKYQ